VKNNIIQNFEKLASSNERSHALLIAEAGLDAIKTVNVVKRVFSYDPKKERLMISGKVFALGDYEKIICVGFGKCAYEAISEIRNILGEKINDGFVLSLTDGQIQGVMTRVGTHPLPSEKNVEATGELMKMLSGLSEKDLVICVVSGGGSSLLCYPNQMSCETEIDIMKKLMHKGADIFELNTVRKHISKVKGGQLAKLCYPATLVGLIFSDVPGDDLSMVASGPTVMDKTSSRDASEILAKFDILTVCKLPKCELIETPKESKYFEKVYNFLVVSAEDAVKAMDEKAKDLGYRTVLLEKPYSGEARNLFLELNKYSKDGAIVLGSGETVVTVKGNGAGGRNQEVVLASLEQLRPNQVFVSLASDGMDNSEVAGAIGDVNTLKRAKKMGMYPEMYLDNNDSYGFFKEVEDFIFTGMTGSNVSDLVILVN